MPGVPEPADGFSKLCFEKWKAVEVYLLLHSTWKNKQKKKKKLDTHCIKKLIQSSPTDVAT